VLERGDEGDEVRSRIVFSLPLRVPDAPLAEPGQPLVCEFAFALPADAPLSTPRGARAYPRRAWTLRAVAAAGQAETRHEFAIEVQRPPARE
jgi:hypothetical protein